MLHYGTSVLSSLFGALSFLSCFSFPTNYQHKDSSSAQVQCLGASCPMSPNLLPVLHSKETGRVRDQYHTIFFSSAIGLPSFPTRSLVSVLMRAYSPLPNIALPGSWLLLSLSVILTPHRCGFSRNRSAYCGYRNIAKPKKDNIYNPS